MHSQTAMTNTRATTCTLDVIVRTDAGQPTPPPPQTPENENHGEDPLDILGYQTIDDYYDHLSV